MTSSTTISCTPEELIAMIRTVVRDEVAARFDRPVSRKEVAELWGCSIKTVDNMVRRGEIRRINPEGMNARFSMNEVMNHKRHNI